MTLTADTVIKKAGGVVAIARASAKQEAYPVKLGAIHKWRHNGIPEPRWSLVIGLCGGDVDERALHKINEEIRSRRT